MVAGLKRIFRSNLTTTEAVDVEGVGTIRFEGNNIYKWVEFAGTTAVAAYEPVCYVLADVDTGTIVDGANTNIAAGISQAAVPAGTPAYGWVQIKGMATVANAFGGTPAEGAQLTSNGATAGALTAVTAATQAPVGIVADVTNKIMFCDFSF
jgi:hypothetical protein